MRITVHSFLLIEKPHATQSAELDDASSRFSTYAKGVERHFLYEID